MTFYIKGHRFGYELQRLAQTFFFGEKIEVIEGAPDDGVEREYLYALLDGQRLLLRARLRARVQSGLFADAAGWEDKKPVVILLEDRAGPGDPPKQLEHKFAALLYGLLSQLTGLTPQWGVLTGIRPVRLFLTQMENGLDEPALRRHFIGERQVSEERFQLALDTARIERPLLSRLSERDFSLYVSIPFCPTRCAYCSFVSHSIGRAAKLIPAYLDRLCEELADLARIVSELGLRLRTVYFGGGTPTSLTAEQLARLMDTISDLFDLSGLWEYTVEAGRPDTVTAEKLRTIRSHGAHRISINPQTLEEGVLREIGRRHTSAQLLEAYQMARSEGFDSINMDLIAGLPTDTREGFSRTLDGVLRLAPENITVHTLTVKRAADLTFPQARAELDLVCGMVDEARQRITSAGLNPYYLYRQAGSLSSLENVGYAKPGTEGLYNIYIMDDSHTVLAVGAGGSTKLCRRSDGRIERVFNYKYPYEYIERFDTVRARKEKIRQFYGRG